jgi:fluoride exporter
VTFLLVALGAAVGAPARYLTDRWARMHSRAGTTLGTLIVNVVGSLVLGVVAAVSRAPGAPQWLMPLVGVGFCGALTTFSTFQVETIRLADDGFTGVAAGYAAASLAAGLAVAAGATVAARRHRYG